MTEIINNFVAALNNRTKKLHCRPTEIKLVGLHVIFEVWPEEKLVLSTKIPLKEFIDVEIDDAFSFVNQLYWGMLQKYDMEKAEEKTKNI